MKRSVSQCSGRWANQIRARPRVTRVGMEFHVGQRSVFPYTHSLRADVSAVAYTGSSGSNKGEPAESSSASLKAESDKTRAEIICVHVWNCSSSHLFCYVLEAISNRVFTHFLT